MIAASLSKLFRHRSSIGNLFREFSKITTMDYEYGNGRVPKDPFLFRQVINVFLINLNVVSYYNIGI